MNQDAAFEVVWKALSSIKEGDMEAALQALSVDECDVLMKYIYRGCDASRLLISSSLVSD